MFGATEHIFELGIFLNQDRGAAVDVRSASVVGAKRKKRQIRRSIFRNVVRCVLADYVHLYVVFVSMFVDNVLVVSALRIVRHACWMYFFLIFYFAALVDGIRKEADYGEDYDAASETASILSFRPSFRLRCQSNRVTAVRTCLSLTTHVMAACRALFQFHVFPSPAPAGINRQPVRWQGKNCHTAIPGWARGIGPCFVAILHALASAQRGGADQAR